MTNKKTLDAATRKKLLSKIKKLMAMAASNSTHEAEIALGQAQRMMAAYGLTDADVQALAIETDHSRSGTKRTPTRWEGHLAQKVAHSMSCKVMFVQLAFGSGAEWEFVGIGPSAQVAAYAFGVLRRQVVKARAEYLAKMHYSNLSTRKKTARADIFCEGWVVECTRAITQFAGTTEQSNAIDKHIDSVTTEKSIEPINRNKKSNLSASDCLAYISGQAQGKTAKLHHGVAASVQQQLQIEL